MRWKQDLCLTWLLVQHLCTLHSISAAGTGFIRVSNGRFVDEDCYDFVAAGLNTYVPTLPVTERPL